jgi:hypothetical protein
MKFHHQCNLKLHLQLHFNLKIWLKRISVVAKYFLQLENVSFKYKPKRLTSIIWKWHSSWKCQPRVNTITIPTIYHFNCKLCTIIIEKYFQLFSISGGTSFANWAWCAPKIKLQFWLNYNYVSWVVGQQLVTCGTLTMLTHVTFTKSRVNE